MLISLERQEQVYLLKTQVPIRPCLKGHSSPSRPWALTHPATEPEMLWGQAACLCRPQPSSHFSPPVPIRKVSIWMKIKPTVIS